MRKASELKFNPVKFDIMGFSGSVGTMGGTGSFFRSSLSQNIAYSVHKSSKTINEIADCLGVSPVYVESEAEFLEEYGFLSKKGDKYLANLLIEEPTTEQNRLQSEMYEKAARLFANRLYDELEKSNFLNGKSGVVYNPLVDDTNNVFNYQTDRNFILWSLIPYIAALSGEKLMDNRIPFEQAATIRPDGANNVAYASVLGNDVVPPKYYDSIKRWFGPCWNGNGKYILWTIDSEWSEKRVDDSYQRTVQRDLSLLCRFLEGQELLSADEYAYLAERGYVRNSGNPYAGITGEGEFVSSLQIVWIKDSETKKELISIGDRIKEKCRGELDALKAPYIKAILDNTPPHLRKMQAFGLQYIFYADGWFLLYCLKELVNNGKLKLPSAEQKKSLTTIILPS